MLPVLPAQLFYTILLVVNATGRRDGPCWLTSFTIIIKVNKKKFCIILLFAHKPTNKDIFIFGIAISKSKQIKSVSLMVALAHTLWVTHKSTLSLCVYASHPFGMWRTCERSGNSSTSTATASFAFIMLALFWYWVRFCNLSVCTDQQKKKKEEI